MSEKYGSCFVDLVVTYSFGENIYWCYVLWMKIELGIKWSKCLIL
jgi:hypothetical protein